MEMPITKYLMSTNAPKEIISALATLSNPSYATSDQMRKACQQLFGYDLMEAELSRQSMDTIQLALSSIKGDPEDGREPMSTEMKKEIRKNIGLLNELLQKYISEMYSVLLYLPAANAASAAISQMFEETGSKFVPMFEEQGDFDIDDYIDEDKSPIVQAWNTMSAEDQTSLMEQYLSDPYESEELDFEEVGEDEDLTGVRVINLEENENHG